MTICITGEGPSDYGKLDGQGDLVKGAAEGFAERIAEERNIKVEWIFVDRRDVERFKLGRRSLRGLKGKAINAAKFRKLASTEQCDKMIYYCDADRDAGAKNSSEHQAESRYDQIYDEVLHGLGDRYPDQAIPMIPLRMIENWLLADRENLNQIFEVNIRENFGNIEILWGNKEDKNSRYPKNVLERIRNAGNPRKRDTKVMWLAPCGKVSGWKNW